MLSDRAIKGLKAGPKPVKIPDSPNLYLLVETNGSKLWRMRYTFDKKEKLLAIGVYPDVGLAEARAARDEAMELVRRKIDPIAERARRRRAEADPDTTFEAVARRWYAKNRPTWRERHAYDVIHTLERDIFPTVGARQITAITSTEMLDVLNKIEARPAVETAHRIRQRCSAVFTFAIASGLCQINPAETVRHALSPVVHGSQPALIGLDEVRQILTDSGNTPAHPITLLALRFIALTAVRPGELRAATWDMFEDLEGKAPLWSIPAEVMKMKKPHHVPLSRQAVEVLEVARTFSRHWPFVFPNARFPQRMMSENALGYLMNRAGYHHRHTAHGWRAAFSSIMNERFPADRHIIDLMLAHAPTNHTEAAYNRALHIQRRTELAQIWADLLLEGAPPPALMIRGPRRRVPAKVDI